MAKKAVRRSAITDGNPVVAARSPRTRRRDVLLRIVALALALFVGGLGGLVVYLLSETP